MRAKRCSAKHRHKCRSHISTWAQRLCKYGIDHPRSNMRWHARGMIGDLHEETHCPTKLLQIG